METFHSQSSQQTLHWHSTVLWDSIATILCHTLLWMVRQTVYCTRYPRIINPDSLLPKRLLGETDLTPETDVMEREIRFILECMGMHISSGVVDNIMFGCLAWSPLSLTPSKSANMECNGANRPWSRNRYRSQIGILTFRANTPRN
jgi:hypothetical protein